MASTGTTAGTTRALGSPGREHPYDLFLPWHRAYLVHFEHVVRDQNEAAIPPWWDWTTATSHREGIPKSYAEAEVAGQLNPLASGPMPKIPGEEKTARTTTLAGFSSRAAQAQRQTPEREGEPLPSLEEVLGLGSYVDFSRQLQNIHDAVHGG